MALRYFFPPAGLTEEQTRARLAEEGANELPSQKERGSFALAR